MSRIGRKPIQLPEGIILENVENFVTVKGKLGELTQQFNSEITISVENDQILVSRSSDEKKFKELHGLTRALLANMIVGVSEGYQKELKLTGVGYTADAKEKFVILNLGYSHPIYFEIPMGISIETVKLTTIFIRGIDKHKVGQVSAKIRSFREPEPYKGKGVSYSNEVIRRKAGKTVGGKK